MDKDALSNEGAVMDACAAALLSEQHLSESEREGIFAKWSLVKALLPVEG